jgi:hypothetical protein
MKSKLLLIALMSVSASAFAADSRSAIQCFRDAPTQSSEASAILCRNVDNSTQAAVVTQCFMDAPTQNAVASATLCEKVTTTAEASLVIQCYRDAPTQSSLVSATLCANVKR